MSGRTRKRLIVAGVVVLVCGVVAFALTHRSRAELALSFHRYETNGAQVKAVVIVSNTSLRTVTLRIGADTSWTPPIHYHTSGPFTLRPAGQVVVKVSVPSEGPHKVVAGAIKDYSSRLGEVRRFLDNQSERFFDYYSLNTPP